eukprot:TRINITY_DN4749_c0_g2_i1.p1 TRINITY_DN4749_c0_g2~~TRINITY_DN4749_c0_g2_i1.p1  ORF type:complete len:924 (-),score=223.20 TRINITY_DN4749_c0_g2_i1:464-3235(-)
MSKSSNIDSGSETLAFVKQLVSPRTHRSSSRESRMSKHKDMSSSDLSVKISAEQSSPRTSTSKHKRKHHPKRGSTTVDRDHMGQSRDKDTVSHRSRKSSSTPKVTTSASDPSIPSRSSLCISGITPTPVEVLASTSFTSQDWTLLSAAAKQRFQSFAADYSIMFDVHVTNELGYWVGLKDKAMMDTPVYQQARLVVTKPSVLLDDLVKVASEHSPHTRCDSLFKAIVDNVRFVQRSLEVSPDYSQNECTEGSNAFGEKAMDRLLKFAQQFETAQCLAYDPHAEALIGWWFPQLVESLTLINLRLHSPHSNLFDDGVEAVTSFFVETASIVVLYLLAGDYLADDTSINPESSSSSPSSSSSVPVHETSYGSSISLFDKAVEDIGAASAAHSVAVRSLLRDSHHHNKLLLQVDGSNIRTSSFHTFQCRDSSGMLAKKRGAGPDDHPSLVSQDENLKLLMLSHDYTVCIELLDMHVVVDVDSQKLGRAVIHYYAYYDELAPLLNTAISCEVARTSQSQELFRCESVATRLLSQFFFDQQGIHYLRQVLRPLLDTICNCRHSLEVDPSRAGLDPSIDVKANMDLLLTTTQNFLDSLLAKADLIPPSFREIFAHSVREAGGKFPEMRQLVVGGFLFLRFICPSLVTPERYGLWPEAPGKNARRGLILVSKLLQNLANGVEFDGAKEEYTTPMNRVITGNLQNILNFFDGLAEYNGSRSMPSLKTGVSPKVMQYLKGNATTTIVDYITRNEDTLRERLQSKSGDVQSTLRTFQLIQEPSIIKPFIQRSTAYGRAMSLMTRGIAPSTLLQLAGVEPVTVSAEPSFRVGQSGASSSEAARSFPWADRMAQRLLAVERMKSAIGTNRGVLGVVLERTLRVNEIGNVLFHFWNRIVRSRMDTGGPLTTTEGDNLSLNGQVRCHARTRVLVWLP